MRPDCWKYGIPISGRMGAFQGSTLKPIEEKITNRKFAEALKQCEFELQTYPNDDHLWHMKSLALEGLGQDAEAQDAETTSKWLKSEWQKRSTIEQRQWKVLTRQQKRNIKQTPP